MEFSNPNQFERIRRLEGLRNFEDIWDVEADDKIKNIVESASPNIEEFVEEDGLTPRTRRCLIKTRIFCADLSEDFKQTFLVLLEQYRNERHEISQKIVNYLLEKDFDKPKFIIANGKNAQKLLKEYNLNVEVNKQIFYFRFNCQNH